MKRENKGKRRTLLFRLMILIPMIVTIGFGIYVLFFSSETHTTSAFELLEGEIPAIREIDEYALDGLNVDQKNRIDYHYALHAQTEQMSSFSFFDEFDERRELEYALSLESPEDTIYIMFENFITDNQGSTTSYPIRSAFVLKIFYNFNEIAFRPMNQELFQTEFLFNLSEGYQVEIPIQLAENIEMDDYLNNLTVAIFANPQYNTVDPLAEWYEDLGNVHGYVMQDYGTGIVSNFTVSYGGSKEIVSIYAYNEIERSIETFNGMAIFNQGLIVDPEIFTRDPKIWGSAPLLPPSPWRVSPGEEIKMGFSTNMGVFSEDWDVPLTEDPIVNEFRIIGLLNWEQVDLSEQPYLFFQIPNGFQYGENVQSHFTITAPTEPGLYDFIAFAISNSVDVDSFHVVELSNFITANHFHVINIAMRFTIEVQEVY